MKTYHLSEDRVVTVKKQRGGELTVSIHHKDCQEKCIDFTPSR